MNKPCNECKNCGKAMIGKPECQRINKATGMPIDMFKGLELNRSCGWFTTRVYKLMGYDLCGKEGRYFEPKEGNEGEQ